LIIQAENHEAISCQIAEEILVQFDYSPEQIQKIKGMIMATRIPQTPTNHLEEILADADLDYLGRDDFEEISERLFKELNFSNRNIAGPFNHRTAYIYLEKLPTHVLLNFSFDLYIHDQWAGYGNNPPDYWGIFIDKQRFFYTTFSNTLNGAQSYPKHEGYLFPPGSDAIEKLPGLYTLKSRVDGTAMYHVVWSIAHTSSIFELALSDLVAESDVSKKSWSIDNLKVVCTKIEQ
jgi:hypothetical protein